MDDCSNQPNDFCQPLRCAEFVKKQVLMEATFDASSIALGFQHLVLYSNAGASLFRWP